MRIYLPVVLFLFSLFTVSSSCQDSDDKILITVNGHQISAAEFEWAYKKNNSGSGRSTIDEYLKLYTDFRLKVEAAKEAGIHRSESFRRELNGYRKQLSRNYLTDQKAKEDLLLNAYERYQEEINALHVLIKCLPDGLPADTVEAWQKAKKIRERIRLGEPFESVARGASDDPNVINNGGNLGYFTVFQTPTSFENKVYSMRPGALSEPIRTSSGYHIIKVQDRRKSNGKVRVAHLMKALPQGASQEQRLRAKVQIDSLYNLAINNIDFATLAIENSDDIASAANGGELPFFGSGEMIMEFSEIAFSLLHDGDISEPVLTVYGWHIIKRLEKEALLPFEEAKDMLERKLSQSYLLSLSRKSFAEKLKQEYNYKINREVLEWFYSIADSTFRSGDIRLESSVIPDDNLFSFAGIDCDAVDFMNYIRDKGTQSVTTDSIRFINTLLDLKSYEALVKYEDSILESKYPEFRYLINEFHDGILLFEISDSLIWKDGIIDIEGLEKYYENRKEEFISPPVASAVIYAIDNQLGKKRVARLVKTIKKYSRLDTGMDLINNSATLEKDTLLTVISGSWKKDENLILDSVPWSEGFHLHSDNRSTYLVEITGIKGPGYLDFNEVREMLVEDYLKNIELEWLKQLRSKYTVIVDEDVLNSIKSKLKL